MCKIFPVDESHEHFFFSALFFGEALCSNCPLYVVPHISLLTMKSWHPAHIFFFFSHPYQHQLEERTHAQFKAYQSQPPLQLFACFWAGPVSFVPLFPLRKPPCGTCIIKLTVFIYRGIGLSFQELFSDCTSLPVWSIIWAHKIIKCTYPDPGKHLHPASLGDWAAEGGLLWAGPSWVGWRCQHANTCSLCPDAPPSACFYTLHCGRY